MYSYHINKRVFMMLHCCEANNSYPYNCFLEQKNCSSILIPEMTAQHKAILRALKLWFDHIYMYANNINTVKPIVMFLKIQS